MCKLSSLLLTGGSNSIEYYSESSIPGSAHSKHLLKTDPETTDQLILISIIPIIYICSLDVMKMYEDMLGL